MPPDPLKRMLTYSHTSRKIRHEILYMYKLHMYVMCSGIYYLRLFDNVEMKRSRKGHMVE